MKESTFIPVCLWLLFLLGLQVAAWPHSEPGSISSQSSNVSDADSKSLERRFKKNDKGNVDQVREMIRHCDSKFVEIQQLGGATKRDDKDEPSPLDIFGPEILPPSDLYKRGNYKDEEGNLRNCHDKLKAALKSVDNKSDKEKPLSLARHEQSPSTKASSEDGHEKGQTSNIVKRWICAEEEKRVRRGRSEYEFYSERMMELVKKGHAGHSAMQKRQEDSIIQKDAEIGQLRMTLANAKVKEENLSSENAQLRSQLDEANKKIRRQPVFPGICEPHNPQDPLCIAVLEHET